MADKRNKQGLTTVAALSMSSYGCYVNARAGAGRRAVRMHVTGLRESLRRHRFAELAGQGGTQRMPGQHRAFHAGGIESHPRECPELS